MSFDFPQSEESWIALTKEDIIELKLLRDALSQKLLHADKLNKRRWLELVEKILSQIK